MSIIAACMNRNELFVNALESWLAALDEVDIHAEIIVVDWSSNKTLERSIKKSRRILRDKRLKLIRVEGQREWILSIAYNLAFSAVSKTSRDLIKFDCDTYISQDFFKEHIVKAGMLYAGNWRKAKDENGMHLNGIFLVSTHDFKAVGGFDERIQTYGYDDEDLYKRFLKKGLRRLDLHQNMIMHLEHEAINRMEYQPSTRYDIDVETSINQAFRVSKNALS